VTGDIALPDAKRMILSYTPWESTLAKTYADQRVLIVSDPRDKVMEVAAQYGLKKATHYSDYAIRHSSVNPFRAAKESGTSHTAVANKTTANVPLVKRPSKEAAEEEPFAAILVFCDPYEWYEAMQVSIDVLCSPTPLSLQYDANAPPMPIHFSNPDFLSKFEHPYPRFAQGAFRVALKALYAARLRALRVPEEAIDEKVGASFRQWGKPTEATYRFVEQRLRELHPVTGPVDSERFYMVGDNPASDMEGARRANIFHRGTSTSWKGVLVRTGVYREGDETNGAAVVVDGVKQAVEWILEQEGVGVESSAKKQKR
jgi:HAD superfamily hydrolase (TIGR01456 family)